MAGIFWTASIPNISLTASTATLIATIEPAANVRIRLKGYKLTVKGVAAIDITARLMEVTGTITGTAVTLQKTPNLGSETIQVSIKSAPSGATVANQPYAYEYLQGSFAEDLDVLLLGGGKYAFEVTATVTATVALELRGEE